MAVLAPIAPALEPGSGWLEATSSCSNPGEGRHGPELGEPSQVLRGGGQQELIPCATRATQSQTRQPQDALEVGKQHLDLLAVVTGALEGRRAGQGSGDIPGILIQIARHPAPGRVGAAAQLEIAALTIGSAWPGRSVCHPW